MNLEKNNIISINGNEHFTFKEILILIKKIKGRPLRIIGIPKSTMFFLMTQAIRKEFLENFDVKNELVKMIVMKSKNTIFLNTNQLFVFLDCNPICSSFVCSNKP